MGRGQEKVHWIQGCSEAQVKLQTVGAVIQLSRMAHRPGSLEIDNRFCNGKSRVKPFRVT